MANKVLFFLDASNKWNRIIRRGVAIFILAGLVAGLNDFIQNTGSLIPAFWEPLGVAVLAMLDKALRELIKKE